MGVFDIGIDWVIEVLEGEELLVCDMGGCCVRLG